MRRTLIKITAYSLMSVLAAVLIVGVAFYVRLSSGPVSLNFMTETFQNQINRNLNGLSVHIDGALIEREPGSGVPHFRLRNIELRDAAGNLIARAPRAAIGIDETQFFLARIVPRSLELIGPRIRVKRNLEGGIELGFGSPAAAEQDVAVIDENQSSPTGKTDQQAVGADQIPDTDVGTTGQSLINILAGGSATDATPISSIETVRISDAAIKFYDEANDAIWDVPKSQLVFQRMPYGFAVVANAEVANGREPGNWHTEVSASYHRDSRSFSVSSRISDLVPANISDEIFALAQLARFRIPLSGQAEMEISDQGLITKASAEFTAAAGQVGLPDYLAEPIIVDEGSLRADYDPATGGIVITDSTLLVGGSKAQITGNVQPVRSAEGRLSALKISLNARNVAIDTQGTVTSPVAVDHIDFVGTAAIDEARLDIDDLVVMSGNTGVRLRGTITGGGESAGILLSGRIRDLSAGLLKRLWPPVMAPKTRAWVNANIKAGRITEGEFQVNLPVDAMANAQRAKHLPDKSIDLHFRMSGVTTGYFKDLPPLTNAEGDARLKDNDFTLSVSGGTIVLPSAKHGAISNGTMVARDILAAEAIGEFNFDATAAAQTVIEYINLPALNIVRNTGFDTSKLGGNATVSVALTVPLIKDAPRDQVKMQASARITGASLKDAIPKIDISEGELAVTIADGKIAASGPVKLNGVPVKLSWLRAPGESAVQSAVIEASLDDGQRKKIGADLGDFLSGSVTLKAEIPDLGDPSGRIDLDADLSQAEMHIAAINWTRPAAAKTQASFTYYSKGGKGRSIHDLVVKGPDLLIKGDITLAASGGLKEAKLSDVRLSDENIFALTIKDGDAGRSIAIRGDSFDARPLIKSMFGTKTAAGGPADDNPEPLAINVNIDRIYAFRGEILTGVTANIRTLGSKVSAAEINGTFLSGQPVVLRLTPAGGGREMRITGRDGGAALRAANLYSKIAGGQIEFYALMANDANSSVQQGKLVLRNFEVRNEAALAQLDTKGKPKKSGPRKGGITFNKLTLPFTTDGKFVRIGDTIAKGDEICATAEGLISKNDNAIDITGTIIPACALNGIFNNIPLVGTILGGGKGEGVIGLSYALGGNMNKPVFQVNPASAILPGFLRKFTDYGNAGTPQQPISRNDNKNSGN